MPFGIRPFRDQGQLGSPSHLSNGSPMPFGIRPFRDSSGILPVMRAQRVSNAFRHSSVSGRAYISTLRHLPALGLQCLSAFVRFGTLGARLLANSLGLQCLSAFVRFGTSAVTSFTSEIPGSPMPFGIRPFRDAARAERAIDCGGESPMPFGIRPFRDGQTVTIKESSLASLQCLSAFVRFGTRGMRIKITQEGVCLQCLSAFVRFGTDHCAVHVYGDHISLQCLSAFVRFGTARAITVLQMCMASLQCLSAFVRFGTSRPPDSRCRRAPSPMPFGIRPFRDPPGSPGGGDAHCESPMPFGIRPFRDIVLVREPGTYPGGSPMPFGIRPFRDQEGAEVAAEAARAGLQCLSAFVRFGTAGGIPGAAGLYSVSPMPFGIRPFRDSSTLRSRQLSESGVSNAFRHSSVSGLGELIEFIHPKIKSPMPFGIRPFRDKYQSLPGFSPGACVSNAFRHSSVSGPALNQKTSIKAICVSNAFRHSSVSGRI